jgi:hypothetical protein
MSFFGMSNLLFLFHLRSPNLCFPLYAHIQVSSTSMEEAEGGGTMDGEVDAGATTPPEVVEKAVEDDAYASWIPPRLESSPRR